MAFSLISHSPPLRRLPPFLLTQRAAVSDLSTLALFRTSRWNSQQRLKTYRTNYFRVNCWRIIPNVWCRIIRISIRTRRKLTHRRTNNKKRSNSPRMMIHSRYAQKTTVSAIVSRTKRGLPQLKWNPSTCPPLSSCSVTSVRISTISTSSLTPCSVRLSKLETRLTDQLNRSSLSELCSFKTSRASRKFSFSSMSCFSPRASAQMSKTKKSAPPSSTWCLQSSTSSLRQRASQALRRSNARPVWRLSSK